MYSAVFVSVAVPTSLPSLTSTDLLASITNFAISPTLSLPYQNGYNQPLFLANTPYLPDSSFAPADRPIPTQSSPRANHPDLHFNYPTDILARQYHYNTRQSFVDDPYTTAPQLRKLETPRPRHHVLSHPPLAIHRCRALLVLYTPLTARRRLRMRTLSHAPDRPVTLFPCSCRP